MVHAVMTQPDVEPLLAAALAEDYRILRSLGHWQLGKVLLAEQIRVGNRKVTLRVVDRALTQDEALIGRLRRTATAIGQLNHPNVATIYECQLASDGSYYIAMEFVEGKSLSERLRQRGRLSLDKVVDIAGQCCKALQAAHRLGVVCRDLHPDNIRLTRVADDEPRLVKLVSAGLASLGDVDRLPATAPYLSYEQASGMPSEDLDGRSDIYSLGMVVYAMLVGHPPFRANTPHESIARHLSETPPPLRMQRPDIPAAVEVAVMKALEKDRGQRYQTAAEFAASLCEAATATSGGAPPRPPWRPNAAEASRPGDTSARAAFRRQPDSPTSGTPASPYPPPWRRRSNRDTPSS